VRVWDVAGRDRPLGGGHGAVVTGLDVAPDGHRFVTGALDGTLRLWDPDKTEAVAKTTVSSPVVSVQFQLNGDVFVAALSGGVFTVDGTTLKLRSEVFKAPGNPAFAAWKGNSQLVVWMANAGLEIFELPALKLLDTLKPSSDAARPHGFAVAGDGKSAATGDTAGHLVFWDLVARRARLQAQIPTAIDAVAISPDDGRVACAAMGGVVLIFDPKTGHELEKLSFVKGLDYATSLTYAREGRELLVGTGRSQVLRFESR
jgi:WD40 repeat protein